MPGWAQLMNETARQHGFAPACERFHFLRHGQTAENFARICQGQRDVPLNDTGIAQAHAAVPLLENQPVSRIVSSDLKRVIMTGDPLIERTGWPRTLDPGLRERTFGILEGGPIPDDLWDRTDEGVEAIDIFTNRVLDATQKAISTNDTLINAHGGILRVIAAGLGLKLHVYAYANALPLTFSRTPSGYTAHAILKEGRFDATRPLPEGVTPPAITTGHLIAADTPA